jgi:catechol 2,3-dioxygenase-like lactoylglutathione lyase family enzyme
VTILRLDHIVLTVESISVTIAFYERILCLRSEELGGRWSLHFATGKLNLHQANHTFDPKAAHPTPGSADLCFITDTKPDDTLKHLHDQSIHIEEGPVERNGTLGTMTSIYIRDPDANLIEIAHYP